MYGRYFDPQSHIHLYTGNYTRKYTGKYKRKDTRKDIKSRTETSGSAQRNRKGDKIIDANNWR